jgi:hypothetical protein
MLLQSQTGELVLEDDDPQVSRPIIFSLLNDLNMYLIYSYHI